MYDTNLQIMYSAIVGPGKMNHTRTFRRLIVVMKWIDELNKRYYISDDKVHLLSNCLLIPYSGLEKIEKYKDVYKLYLSQIYI